MVNLLKFNKSQLGEMLTPEKIFSFRYKEEFQKLYEKVNFDNINYLKIANLFLISIFISIILFIFSYPYLYVQFNDYIASGPIYEFIVIFISFFLFLLFTYYLVLFFYFFSILTKFKKIEKQIEEDLPDFLDNLVSNLKGGISLEKALLRSVRKNQKILLKEITLINEKILMGMTTLEALNEFRERFINSPVISRTFFLIDEGLKTGGNLAEPLEKISENLKNIYTLNDEIRSSLGGFSVVIMAISIFVAPLLFALAITLLNFIGNLFNLLSKSGADLITVSEIPTEFTLYLINFSYAMISLIVIFSSLITSQLKNEKIYESIKYIPIFLFFSLILYWLFSKLLLTFFGNLF
jgi:pilus assembly protein TadC